MGIHYVDDGLDFGRSKSIPGVLIPWQLPKILCQEKAAAQELQDPSPAVVNAPICFPGKISRKMECGTPCSSMDSWNGLDWEGR